MADDEINYQQVATLRRLHPDGACDESDCVPEIEIGGQKTEERVCRNCGWGERSHS